jgi:hypothetical protein
MPSDLSSALQFRLAKLFLLALADFVYEKLCAGRPFEDVDQVRFFLSRRKVRDYLDLAFVQMLEIECRMVSISNKLAKPATQAEIRHFVNDGSGCRPMDRILHNEEGVQTIILELLIVIFKVKTDPLVIQARMTVREAFAVVLPSLNNEIYGRLLPTPEADN